ncbi:hypothetical protein MKW92_022777, partial [Papaver armeniacum]
WIYDACILQPTLASQRDAIPPARVGLAFVAPNGTDGSSAVAKQNAFAPSQGPLPSSSYVTQTPAPGNPPLNDVWEKDCMVMLCCLLIMSHLY